MFDDPRIDYLQDIFQITRKRFGSFILRMAKGTYRQDPRSFAADLKPRWNLNYRADFPRGARLYDVAKQKGWDPKRDINYDRRIPRSELVLDPDAFMAMHLGLEGICDEETMIRLSHAEMDWMLSQILHGEQGALMLCSQLINVHRDMDGKLFLASQAMDEARHIEAFNRYIQQQGRVYEIDFGVKFVIDAFLTTDNWRKQAIGMLVLVEGYALGTFAVMEASILDPVLRDILKFVMRDEGRHVGFGLAAIHSSLDELEEQEREEIEDYAFSLVRSVAFARNSKGGFRDICDLYWRHLGPKARKHISYDELQEMISTHPIMEEFNSIVFESNLLPNLHRLGLLSERVRPRYASINLDIAPWLASSNRGHASIQ